MFSDTTDEQKLYLNERLVQPAYERFVQLVTEGRKDKLSEREVRTLADGGIYTASEALTCKLIDQIGYFEQAVKTISERAGVGNPTVVEYSEKFSMMSILGAEAKTGLTIDAELFDKLLTPQLMYLWDGRR